MMFRGMQNALNGNAKCGALLVYFIDSPTNCKGSKSFMVSIT